MTQIQLATNKVLDLMYRFTVFASVALLLVIIMTGATISIPTVSTTKICVIVGVLSYSFYVIMKS